MIELKPTIDGEELGSVKGPENTLAESLIVTTLLVIVMSGFAYLTMRFSYMENVVFVMDVIYTAFVLGLLTYCNVSALKEKAARRNNAKKGMLKNRYNKQGAK